MFILLSLWNKLNSSSECCPNSIRRTPYLRVEDTNANLNCIKTAFETRHRPSVLSFSTKHYVVFFMASRITQSLSFHQSPELFVVDRLQKLGWQRQHDGATPIIRAEILNRNVHLISSYKLCKAILCDNGSSVFQQDDSLADFGPQCERQDQADNTTNSAKPIGAFAASPAYEQLMLSFFPRPNILLEDGIIHAQHKAIWLDLFRENIIESSIPLIREVTLKTFIRPIQAKSQNHQIDLYETMKKLSWDLLFAVFLGAGHDEDRSTFQHIRQLQERVLTGQFSMFPVSVRTPFWTSARSRGLKAVRELGPAIRNILRSQLGRNPRSNAASRCPFVVANAPIISDRNDMPLDEEDIVSHVRLFTSSIANKALASLLTAFLMNLFVWRDNNTSNAEPSSLASIVASQGDTTIRFAILDAVLSETERLSPPVIGVMRRVMENVDLDTDDGSYSIPAGHDAWLYLVGANRDPSMFHQPDSFQWDRFMTGTNEANGLGMAFGAGAKQCLGYDLAHQICLTVAETIVAYGIRVRGTVVEEGVREWLGWQHSASPYPTARDVKQLPCQRPRRPLMVATSTGDDFQVA